MATKQKATKINATTRATARTAPAVAATGIQNVGGGTQAVTPTAAAAVRGAVQKTFTPARLLSGFTDANHFELIVGEYLASLIPAQQQRIRDGENASRAHVAQLPPFQNVPVILRQIQHQHIIDVRAHALFAESFGQRPH